MSRKVYAGLDRILPGELDRFEAELAAVGSFDGVVFFDPEDGVSPVHLAHLARARAPGLELVLPLVGRDCNRTSLLGLARTAEALGAEGLLLLSGHLDPASPAKTVYELDALQLLGFLDAEGVRTPRWIASRATTAAERARVESLARAGAARCLVLWPPDREDLSPPPPLPTPSVVSVPEHLWLGGRTPAAGDAVLHVSAGRLEAAAALAAALRARP